MGICKFVDAILFIYFLIITIWAPLLDSQTCLPSHFYPDFLIQAKSWYTQEYGDYLFDEKPHFFKGLMAVELLLQWPLAVASLYAMVAKKSWYNTTCLIQGVATFTSMGQPAGRRSYQAKKKQYPKSPIQMGICKIVDVVLFIYFLIISIAAPLLDSQTCLPSHFYPDFLIQAKSWYTQQYDDYLFYEKPHFFKGLMALELLLQWPLAVASLYAIVAKKFWYNTTCLIQGVATFTSMVAILADMVGSKKASDKLLMVYSPFLGFALLAVLRGLVPASRKTPARSSVARKKRV